MTARQVFDAAAGFGSRKTRGSADSPTDPVRKHSYDLHDRRAKPWRKIGVGTLPFGKAFVAALTRTLTSLYEQQYDEDYRGPGRLQRSHLRVLPAILSKLDFASGRLDPSWATIAADARCSRGVLDQALEALHYHGFVCSIRRTIRKDGAEGQRGPQREQISNAFYFDCRSRMAPDVYARFWSYLLEELAKFGRWLKSRARAILNTFNPEAVPSPREPRVARLVRKARAAMHRPERPPQPTRAPIAPPPKRPRAPAVGITTPALNGIRDKLSAMALDMGLDPDEALNASPE